MKFPKVMIKKLNFPALMFAGVMAVKMLVFALILIVMTQKYLMLAEMIKNSSLIPARIVKLPLVVRLEQTNPTFCIVMI